MAEMYPAVKSTGLSSFVNFNTSSGKFQPRDTFVKLSAEAPDGLDPETLHKSGVSIAKREYRYLKQVCGDHAAAEFPIKVRIDKARILIHCRNDTDVHRLEQSGYLVALIIWEGLGPPSPLYESGFARCSDNQSGNPIYVPARDPKKFWLPRDGGSKNKWRWSMVALFRNTETEATVDEWFDRVRNLFSGDQLKDLHTHQLRIDFKCERLTLSELVAKTRYDPAAVARTFFNTKADNDSMHALLKLHYNGRPTLAVHGNKFFDSEDDKSFDDDGIIRAAGNLRVLKHSSEDQILVSQVPCSKLFLKAQPVSRFISECYGFMFVGKDMDEDFWRKCHSALRNIRVQIPDAYSAKGGRIQQIKSVSRLTSKTVSDHQKHLAWPKDKVLNYKLPLMNFGSLMQPRLLPAEACTILPMQTFKGLLDDDTRAKLMVGRASMSLSDMRAAGHPTVDIDSLIAEFLNPEAPSRILGRSESFSDDGSSETSIADQQQDPPRPSTEQKSETVNGQPSTADEPMAQTHYLFVMPMVSPTDAKLWRQLRRSVFQAARDPTTSANSSESGSPIKATFPATDLGHEEVNSRSLSLIYNPDRLDIAQSQWPGILKTFVDHHRKRAADSSVAVVLCLSNDKGSRDIYKILKRACDLDAGVHSICINYRSLATKLATWPRDGAGKAANNIIHRHDLMINSPILTPEYAGNDIAIAMHVTPARLPLDVCYINGTRSSTVQAYFVSCVSRGMTSDDGYKTETHLLIGESIQPQKHSSQLLEILRDFFDSLPRTQDRQVTLFRSGFVNHDGATRSSRSRAYANKEHEKIQDLLRKYHGIDVTYARLDEDRVSRICLANDSPGQKDTSATDEAVPTWKRCFVRDSDAARHSVLALKTYNRLTSARASNAVDVTLWPHVIEEPATQRPSTPHRLADRTRSTQSYSPVPSTPTDMRLRAARSMQALRKASASGKAKAIVETTEDPTDLPRLPESASNSPGPQATATLQDRRHQDEEVFQQDAGAVETPSRTSIAGPAITPSGEEDPSSGFANELLPPSADLYTRLGRVWKDDRLGIDQTTWPIPTHLARLAARHAMLHVDIDQSKSSLSKDAPEGNKIPEADRLEACKAISLRRIPEALKDTLYYL